MISSQLVTLCMMLEGMSSSRENLARWKLLLRLLLQSRQEIFFSNSFLTSTMDLSLSLDSSYCRLRQLKLFWNMSRLVCIRLTSLLMTCRLVFTLNLLSNSYRGIQATAALTESTCPLLFISSPPRYSSRPIQSPSDRFHCISRSRPLFSWFQSMLKASFIFPERMQPILVTGLLLRCVTQLCEYDLMVLLTARSTKSNLPRQLKNGTLKKQCCLFSCFSSRSCFSFQRNQRRHSRSLSESRLYCFCTSEPFLIRTRWQSSSAVKFYCLFYLRSIRVPRGTLRWELVCVAACKQPLMRTQ